MSSRSAASRRRKRNSTSQSVDLLNNVNSPNKPSRAPPTRKSRAASTQELRHDIGEDPVSPEMKSPLPSTHDSLEEPVTPRRSARIHNRSPNQAMPDKNSLPLHKKSPLFLDGIETGSRLEEVTEMSEKTAEKKESNDHPEHHKSGDVLQEGLNDTNPVQLFSDSEDNADEIMHFPSPSVYFKDTFAEAAHVSNPAGKEVELAGDDKIESGNSSQDNSRSHTPDQDDKSPPPNNNDIFASHLQPMKAVVINPVPRPAPGSPQRSALVVNRRQSSSPKKTRFRDPSPVHQTPTEDSVRDNEEKEDEAYVPSSPDASDKEESESDSERSPLADHSPDPSEEVDELFYPVKRRRLAKSSPRKRPRIETARRRESPPRVDPQSNPSSTRASRQETPTDTAKTNQLNAQALTLGGQKPNWAVLLAIRNEMKEARSSRPERSFQSIQGHLSQLLKEYKGLKRYLLGFRPPPAGSEDLCNDLLNTIKEEGIKLLEGVYLDVTSQTELDRGARSIDDFEGHVMVPMLRLLLICFSLHYESGGQSRFTTKLLRRTIKELDYFCKHASKLVQRYSISSDNPSRGMRPPLKKLMEALNHGHLNRNRATGSEDGDDDIEDGNDDIEDGDDNIESAPQAWTGEEGTALVEGLQTCHGHDRYARILQQFSEELQRRTEQELRLEAIRLRDWFMSNPRHKAEIQTDKGADRWAWLLSVEDE